MVGTKFKEAAEQRKSVIFFSRASGRREGWEKAVDEWEQSIPADHVLRMSRDQQRDFFHLKKDSQYDFNLGAFTFFLKYNQGLYGGNDRGHIELAFYCLVRDAAGDRYDAIQKFAGMCDKLFEILPKDKCEEYMRSFASKESNAVDINKVEDAKNSAKQLKVLLTGTKEEIALQDLHAYVSVAVAKTFDKVDAALDSFHAKWEDALHGGVAPLGEAEATNGDVA